MEARDRFGLSLLEMYAAFGLNGNDGEPPIVPRDEHSRLCPANMHCCHAGTEHALLRWVHTEKMALAPSEPG